MLQFALSVEQEILVHRNLAPLELFLMQLLTQNTNKNTPLNMYAGGHELVDPQEL